MMRIIALLALLGIGILPAYSQGVTRLCVQTTNTTTGNISCQDISSAYPLPVTSSGGGGTVNQGTGGNSPWLMTSAALGQVGQTVPGWAVAMGYSVNGTTQIPIGDPNNSGLWIEAAPGSALLTALQAGTKTAGGAASAKSVQIEGFATGTSVPTTAKPTTGTAAYSAATVNTTDAVILSASTATVFLDVVNNSQSATICINFGAAAVISAGTCAAGNVTLPPLFHRSWEANFFPTDAIHAVASSAGVPATVAAK